MPDLNVVLASASPRRRVLLRLLNHPFDVLSSEVDETPQPGESATAMVERLSVDKAMNGRARAPHAVIIAADTTVELDGKIIGKPRDANEARAMLQSLRGRVHSVYTGCALSHPSAPPLVKSKISEAERRGGRQGGIRFTARTRVWMRNYSDAEIEAYIATGDPLDKAAAYAVQHRDFQPVARVEGCFANVMGLPLCHLYNALAKELPMPEPVIECYRHPEENCSVESRVSSQ